MGSKIIWLDCVRMADLVSDRKSRFLFHQSDNKKISHKRPGVGKETFKKRKLADSQNHRQPRRGDGGRPQKNKSETKADAESPPTGGLFVVHMRMHTKHKKKHNMSSHGRGAAKFV